MPRAIPSSSANGISGAGVVTSEREVTALDSNPKAQQTKALALSDVGLTYDRGDGQEQEVLRSVNLSVAEGELLCVLGASGCGKTSLLNMCAGFEVPTAGTVSSYGTEITGPSRSRVVVFQDSTAALLGWKTVQENVEYALRINRSMLRRRSAQDRETAKGLLSLVRLADDCEKYPFQLSGGGRQRVQLARAFAAQPRILLMDEPLGALDALTRLDLQHEIVRLVAEMNTTVMYITHDLHECARIADRVVVLSGPSYSTVTHDLKPPQKPPRDIADPDVASFVSDLEGVMGTH